METKQSDPTPGVSLEVTSFILRMGPDHVYGSPWESSITGVIFNGCAYLSAMKGWDHKYSRPILQELARIGCKKVCYIRMRKDGTKHVAESLIPEKYFNKE